MSLEGFVKHSFSLECKGRDGIGNEVLDKPEQIILDLTSRKGSNEIKSSVVCPYNTGSHGRICKASHPEFDKKGEGAICPYSFDIPYAIDTLISTRADYAKLKKSVVEEICG